MGVTRVLVTRMLGAVVLAAVLVGCGGPAPAGPVIGGPLPASATPTSAPPTSIASSQVTGTTEPPDPSEAPNGLDPATVPGCEAGCEVAFDIALAGGGRFAALQGNAPGTGFPQALLVHRTAAGDVRVAEPVTAAYAEDGGCAELRCVATFGVGAHGTNAVVVDLAGDAIAVTGLATSGTPDAAVTDLDGDGRLDLALRQTTGEPSYAAAPRFWQTWRDDGGPGPASSEGDPDPAPGSLELTGCGDTTTTAAPSTLLVGPCPPA